MKNLDFHPKPFGLRVLAMLGVCVVLLNSVSAGPFTYQGRLTEGGGVPATGQYDFSFGLWDAHTLGTQVGTALVLAPVAANNGVFSVTLDFGEGVFNGSGRWLQISVRPNGSTDPYQVLTPRQAVTFTPQAGFALAVADGAITPAKITGVINSANIPNLDASKITTGTIAGNLIDGTIARTTSVGALEATVTTLSAQVAALIGSSQTPALAGATFVSADPADAILMASGLQKVVTVAAPAWANGSTSSQPSGRSGHSVLWTGQEMVVWGGTIGSGLYSAQGGTYRTDVDTWAAVSTVGAPSARSGHSAIWTGSKMMVWGGFSGTSYLDTGGQFSIANQTWNTLPTVGAPATRESHVAVWTGSRMVIWGGRNFTGMLADGALFDPISNLWETFSLPSTPAARSGATGIWANDTLLVWGGNGETGFLNTGSKLICTGGVPSSWLPISLQNAPSARSGHSAVWTGSKLIVWGGTGDFGLLGDGATYNPATDTWTPLSGNNAPTARTSHTAVWTGSEMIVLGGETSAGATATGGAYDPTLNKWRVLSNPGSPVARTEASLVWTGTELLSYGGLNGGSYIASLQRLNPQPAWYFYKKP